MTSTLVQLLLQCISTFILKFYDVVKGCTRNRMGIKTFNFTVYNVTL